MATSDPGGRSSIPGRRCSRIMMSSPVLRANKYSIMPASRVTPLIRAPMQPGTSASHELDLLGPDRQHAGRIARRRTAEFDPQATDAGKDRLLRLPASDAAGEQVGRADEVGDEAGRAVARRSPRASPICSMRPWFMTDDPVGHRQRLVLVVRDEQCRDADLLLQPPDLVPHLHRAASRRGWTAARRTAAAAARAPAPGPARRAAAGRPRARADSGLPVRRGRPARAPPRRAVAISAARRVAASQAEGDVAAHRHVRKQRVALEHHAHVAPVRRQRR